jgi:hypothetical protein
MSKTLPAPHNTPPKPSGVVDRAPGDLKLWPANPRTHSDKQLVKLKASIQKFDFTAPALVDEADVILNGRGHDDTARLDPPGRDFDNFLGSSRLPSHIQMRANGVADRCRFSDKGRPSRHLCFDPIGQPSASDCTDAGEH